MHPRFKYLWLVPALVVAALVGRVTASSSRSSEAPSSLSCAKVAMLRDGSVRNESGSAVTVVYSVLGAAQYVNKYAGSIEGVDGDIDSTYPPESFQKSFGSMPRVRGVLVVPAKSVVSVGLYAPRLWTSDRILTDTGPLPAHLVDFVFPSLETCNALAVSGSDRFESSLGGVADACAVSDLVAIRSGSSPPVYGGRLSPNALAGAGDVCSVTSSEAATRTWLSKRSGGVETPIVVQGWTFERDSTSIRDQIAVSTSQRCVAKGVKASAADIVTPISHEGDSERGQWNHFSGVELFASSPGATATLAIRWTTNHGGTTPWVELSRVLASERGWITRVAHQLLPDFDRLGTDVGESTTVTGIEVVTIDCDAMGFKADSVPVVERDAQRVAKGFELFLPDGPRPDSEADVAAAVGASNPVVAMVRQEWYREVDYLDVEYPYVEVQWDSNVKCVFEPAPSSTDHAEVWPPCFDRQSGPARLKFSAYTEVLYQEEIGGM